MVKGGRNTINLPAVLAPYQMNVVRVARYNACIDEGQNEVSLLNEKEIDEQFGSMITVAN